MHYLTYILFLVCLVLLGPLVIEVAGYFWHRFVEHEGVAGSTIQQQHIQHHQEDYPTNNLRPDSTKYIHAKSWSWYVLTVILIGLALLIIPRPYSFATIIGGLVYAKFVVSYFHRAFHLPHHWLHKYRWFRSLTKLHDIHHYQVANFGIVFFFMDKLMGTYKSSISKKPNTVFAHLKS